MKIRKDPEPLKENIDRKVLDRRYSEMDATLFRGTDLEKPFLERFPNQPPLLLENPAYSNTGLTTKERPSPTMMPIDSDFWRRALALSNQAAIHRHIAQRSLNEKITDERVHVIVETNEDTVQRVNTRRARHEMLTRLAIYRAAALITKLDIMQQREMIKRFLFIRFENNKFIQTQVHKKLEASKLTERRRKEAVQAEKMLLEARDAMHLFEAKMNRQEAINAYIDQRTEETNERKKELAEIFAENHRREKKLKERG